MHRPGCWARCVPMSEGLFVVVERLRDVHLTELRLCARCSHVHDPTLTVEITVCPQSPAYLIRVGAGW